ncbi:MAG TPA: hypothetical protein VFG68_17840 [Fimbriiglobus sp.]|nr:hypothetical protein [Fimbriiglobus sp.]
MTCDAIRNRLLALPDLRRVPDELRGHLDECPACRAYQARAVRLDGWIKAIPVPPSSEETKAAFLDRATEAGPVIKRVPVVRRDSALYLPAFLAENGRWRYAAGLAAAVLIAVGWLTYWGDGTPKPNEPLTVAGHDLLTKTIGHVVTDKDALAKVDTPEQRMRVWADMTRDLQSEIKRVYLYAPQADLTVLAGLFEKVTEKGLLRQAGAVKDSQLPPDRQQALLRGAIEQMAAVEADLAAFAQNAPQGNKLPLRQIRGTAQRVREELSKLEPRLAGSVPAKGV